MTEVENQSNQVSKEDLENMLSQLHESTSLSRMKLNEPELSREGRMQERVKRLEAFKVGLISNKDRFIHVFETELGSVYFQLADGSCLRIKETEQGPKIEPITNKLFFVTPEKAEELKNFTKTEGWQEQIIGRDISKTSLQEGVVPVDFGIEGQKTVNFKEEDSKITILGDEDEDFASGFHIGHKVTRVY